MTVYSGSKEVNRGGVIRLALLSGLSLAAACATFAIQGEQILYDFEKNFVEKPRPKPATVLLVKLIGKNPVRLSTGAGTFITPEHILTAKHLLWDKTTVYAKGTDFAGEFSRGNEIENNIAEVAEHPDVDLAILRLKKPDINISCAKIGRITAFSDKLSVVITNRLIREEKFAGRLHAFVDYDAFGNNAPADSYIELRNNVTSQGDSGSGLYTEEKNELIGVVSGRITSSVFGINPRSLYANLLCPEVKAWITSFIG